MDALELMRRGPVIPVIVIEDLAHAVPLAKALVAGGVRVLEITLRTRVALDAISAISRAVEEKVRELERQEIEALMKEEAFYDRLKEGFNDIFLTLGYNGNAEDALRYVRGHKPDVLVIDLNMPGGSTLDAIPEIRGEAPDTQIVILTMQNEPAYARQALAAGVMGYVLKEAADDELLEAVRRAAAGDTYLNPRLGARLAAEPPPGPPDGLSDREVEVLTMIALGHTNTEIAEQLYLSVRTVETHRAHIQQKTGRTTRADLVAYAHEHDLT